jgi:hypothetical protein
MNSGPLTREDVRDLLAGFAAAITLDQIRVDALPSEKFHPAYSDSTWRMWRRGHLDYVDLLLRTVNTISIDILQDLTRIAIYCEPRIVRRAVIDVFGEAVCCGCLEEEFGTAAQFFGWLKKEVRGKGASNPLGSDARALMRQWVSVTDPLRIAEDPECGYGRPRGFVS